MTKSKKVDLLGIGNAITDILITVDYKYLEKMNLNIGAMQLVEFVTINNISALVPIESDPLL